ncbi:MAG: hypothetical protein ACFFD2_05330 [Promethearchaeota archaeon]
MYFLYIRIKNIFGLNGETPLLNFPVCICGENRTGKTLFLHTIKIGLNGTKESDIPREDIIPNKLETGSVVLWFYQMGYIYKIIRKYRRSKSSGSPLTPSIKLELSEKSYKEETILNLDYNEMKTFIRGIKYSKEEVYERITSVAEKLKMLRIYPEVCKFLFVDRTMKAYERSVSDGLYDVGNLIVEQIKLLKENSLKRGEQCNRQKSKVNVELDNNNNALKALQSQFKDLIEMKYWNGSELIEGYAAESLIFDAKNDVFSRFYKNIDKIKSKWNDITKQLKQFKINFRNLADEHSQAKDIEKVLKQSNNITKIQRYLGLTNKLIEFIEDLKVNYRMFKLGSDVVRIKDLSLVPQFPKIPEISSLIDISDIKLNSEDFEGFKAILEIISDYIHTIKELIDLQDEFTEYINFDDLITIKYNYQQYLSNVKSPKIITSELTGIPANICYSKDTGFELYVDLENLTEDISKVGPFIQIYSKEGSINQEKKQLQKKIITRIEKKVKLLDDCERKYNHYLNIQKDYYKNWLLVDKVLKGLTAISKKLSNTLAKLTTEVRKELEDKTILGEKMKNLFEEEQKYNQDFQKVKLFLDKFKEQLNGKISDLEEKLLSFQSKNKDIFNFSDEILNEDLPDLEEIGEDLCSTVSGILSSELELIKAMTSKFLFYFEHYKSFLSGVRMWIKDHQLKIVELNNNIWILSELYNNILPFTEGILLQSIIDTIQTETLLKDIIESVKIQTESMYYAIFGDRRLTIDTESAGEGRFSVIENYRKGGVISYPSGSESPTLSFGIMYALAKKFDLPMLLDETIDGFDTPHTNAAIDEILNLSQKFNLQCIMVIKDNKEIDKDHRIYNESLIIEMDEGEISWK